MKTNNLTYKISVNNENVNCVIKIQLADECKNGHEDFSLTATFWTIGKPRNDFNLEMAGCCHKEILKHFPDLQIFADLHLSDFQGIPMYVLENGFYHYGKGITEFKNYLRLTNDDIKKFGQIENQTHLYILLLENGIIERWQNEARQAIEMLESYTGMEFESKAVKTQLNAPSEDIIKAFRENFANGFYAPEKIQERFEAKKENARQKVIDDLKANAQKEIDKINTELKIKLAILENGVSIENFIYYNHSNTGVFNWRDCSYLEPITENEFNALLEKLDFSKLPEGIQFKLGK